MIVDIVSDRNIPMQLVGRTAHGLCLQVFHDINDLHRCIVMILKCESDTGMVEINNISIVLMLLYKHLEWDV